MSFSLELGGSGKLVRYTNRHSETVRVFRFMEMISGSYDLSGNVARVKTET